MGPTKPVANSLCTLVRKKLSVSQAAFGGFNHLAPVDFAKVIENLGFIRGAKASHRPRYQIFLVIRSRAHARTR